MNIDMYEVAKYFFDKKISVHIDLTNGKWLNGKIIELQEDRIILDEKMLGIFPIFFIRINSIVPERKDGRKND